MQKELVKRLTDYAAFAAAVLVLINRADAEVVYTDIDPDVSLDTDGNYYAIDIDGNGTADFQFLKATFSINPSFTYYYYFQELVAGPFSQNAIGGATGISFYTGAILYFPFALPINSIISNELTWQNSTFQFLAWKTWTDDYDNHCNNCFWNTKDLYEVLDHYLGIRFIDIENNNHYGWIRCDVKEDGSLLILKDYAYETEPDYPILAGSKTTYQEIEPGNIEGEIYATGNTVHISVPHRPTPEYTVQIYNMSGQLVVASQYESPFVEIQIEVPRGIYIVRVTSANEQLSKEVLIE